VPRKPYRSPRDWLRADQTRLFGTSPASGLQWRAPQSRLETALLAAAQRQSDLAFSIRISMSYDRATSALAAFADLHPETVRDVLNGSKHVSITALYALTLGVGLDLNVTASKVIGESSPEARAT
jgi:hypothetical protein